MVLKVNKASQYGVFLLSTFVCLIIGSIVAGLVLGTETSAARVRIAIVLQDVIMFVTPAIATAVIVAQLPARYLMVDRCPTVKMVVLPILTMLAAIPLMNVVIAWNEGLSLPASLAGLEEMMRSSEDAANAMVKSLISGSRVGSLVIVILILGVLAGFSEEMFFRGGLQRLMITTSVNAHVAIWLTAIIFSAIHLQFYGFVPRMLLGAYFGYLAWWSRNLWIPIIAHTTNNILAGIEMWLGDDGQWLSELGTCESQAGQYAINAVSLVVTVTLMVLTYRALKASKNSDAS